MKKMWVGSLQSQVSFKYDLLFFIVYMKTMQVWPVLAYCTRVSCERWAWNPIVAIFLKIFKLKFCDKTWGWKPLRPLRTNLSGKRLLSRYLELTITLAEYNWSQRLERDTEGRRGILLHSSRTFLRHRNWTFLPKPKRRAGDILVSSLAKRRRRREKLFGSKQF